MTSVLAYFTGAVTLAAAANRWRASRTVPSQALQAFCWVLTFLGFAFLLLSNASLTFLTKFTGNLGLDKWIGNSLTLAAACSGIIMLSHLTRGLGAPEPRTWPRVIVLVISVTAMGALILSSPSANVAGFGTRNSALPTTLGYLLIYLTYLGAAMARGVLLRTRYSLPTTARHLRMGRWLMASGCITGLAYVAYKAMLAVELWLGLSAQLSASACTTVLSSMTALQIAIGGTAGAWGQSLGTWLHRRRQSYSSRQLRPLWQALCQVVPEMRSCLNLGPTQETSASGCTDASSRSATQKSL